MKAIEINEYGSADVLLYKEDSLKPQIGDYEILVRNKASSVNPVDTLKREGYGYPVFEKKRRQKFPWILGNDTAGIVVEVGAKVTMFNVGDEIYGTSGLDRQGTWAEYSAIAEEYAAIKPNNLTFEEAGAIPYVALTTWAALVDNAKLTPTNAIGKRVLVHAGSGGVGTFAIQLLKAWGCYVATTCSTRNIELVKSLGADEVIDYTQDDFSRILSNFDLVYDTLGHKREGNEEKSIAILKRNSNAAYVSIVHPMLSYITDNGLFLGFLKSGATLLNKKFKNRGIKYHWSLFKPNGKALEQVRQYIESGKIKAVVEKNYAMNEMAEAHKYIATGRARGKVVITI